MYSTKPADIVGQLQNIILSVETYYSVNTESTKGRCLCIVTLSIQNTHSFESTYNERNKEQRKRYIGHRKTLHKRKLIWHTNEWLEYRGY